MTKKIAAIIAVLGFVSVFIGPPSARASDDCGGERWHCQGDAVCNGGVALAVN